ncbi:MAG TPA: AMP-binding protein, partial [Chloroflexota bacterium]|nr:AMP-binding protein [Chloroflexota bacterium]
MPSDRPWLKNYPPRVSPTLAYREIPLYQLLAESAARHPDLPALRFYQHRLTYGQLWDQSQSCASGFAGLGVRPGDRIALMLPNCPQYVVAYYGALLAGAIVVQVNPLYTARELQHQLTNAGAETIVVADALYPVVQGALEQTPLKRAVVTRLRGEVPLGTEAQSFEAMVAGASATPPKVVVNAQDVAVLQYTGGTTGVSKGAMLTHFNLVANVAQCVGFNPEAPPPGEGRFLTIIPLFHVYGMTVCMNLCLATGGELILLPRFDLAEVMETIKATRPTHFPGVPTMYVAVNGFPNAESYGLDSIKFLNSGAAPMPVEVMAAYEARFGGKILEGYGLSEASPFTHGHPPLAVRKPGTVGMPAADTDCEIVDLDLGTRVLPAGEAGEIRIKGPQI